MSWLSNIFKTAVSVIGTAVDFIATEVVPGVKDVVGTIAKMVGTEYKKIRDEYRDIDLEQKKKEQFNDIGKINEAILDYERKRRRDGFLNAYAVNELDALKKRRDELAGEVRDIQEVQAAEEIAEEADAFENIIVTDGNTHVLQFHAGQTIFDKVCRRCKRPMILQWDRKKGAHGLLMKDFFWGCTGYYETNSMNVPKSHACQSTEPFRRKNMSLFTRADRPEFTDFTTCEEFIEFSKKSGPLGSIKRKMRGIINEPNETYICPVHNEPMVLKEKREPDASKGLLDHYFMGCPRWNKDGTGCTQMVKLASPAQVASALERHYGKGAILKR